jgi:hypothetical protein
VRGMNNGRKAGRSSGNGLGMVGCTEGKTSCRGERHELSCKRSLSGSMDVV